MKTNMMYLAAALLLTACSPKASNMTKVVAQFGDDAPESVRIVIGATNMPSLDTIVPVKNGRLEAMIPKNLVGTACLFPGFRRFHHHHRPGGAYSSLFQPGGHSFALSCVSRMDG